MKTPSINAVTSHSGKLVACLMLGVAALTQSALPVDYATVALSNSPAAFWQFTETGDPTTGTLSAADSSGNGLNGTYGTGSQNGGPGGGWLAPNYPGFAVNQGSLKTTDGDTNSAVSFPALNLSSTVVDTTIAMWINPLSQPIVNAGLMFDRSGNGAGPAVAGFGFQGTNTASMTRLGYNWNDSQGTWGWNSGLYPKLNQWSFVSLVVQSNRATIRLYYKDAITGDIVLASAVNNTNHSPVTWSGAGPRLIGRDSFNDAWIFPGQISGAVIYNSALTEEQLLSRFAAGLLGTAGLPPIVTEHPRPQYLLANANTQLRGAAIGNGTLTYQWQLNGVNVNNGAKYSGATSNVLTITGVTASEAGPYRLVVTGAYGTTNSSNATVTIHTPTVVGKWFTNATLNELSGFAGGGMHTAVANGAASYYFTNDVPNGKGGQSVVVQASGFHIANSSTLDTPYVNTFDDRIQNAYSVAVWVKGWPSQTWNPFVSKFGEFTPAPAAGWQLRAQGSVSPCWTVRGSGGTNILGQLVGSAPSEDLVDNSLNLGSDLANWHYYVGTYDLSAGVRSLYVDGLLRAQTTNSTRYVLATNAFVAIGARDYVGVTFSNWFTGSLYDARIYNYSLSGSEVLTQYGVQPPGITIQPRSNVPVLAGYSATLSSAASGTPVLGYNWQLNGVNVSSLPNSANYAGATSNVLTILSMSANEAGTYRLMVTNAYGTAFSSNAVVSLATPTLVGRWFTNESLADTSGYTPSGTHDATPVGGGQYTFTNDVPYGLTGSAIQFTANSGMAILNSSTNEPSYLNTFDETIRSYMTVTFWAKGWPGEWNPFISKRGETDAGVPRGWQLRRSQGLNNAAWTIRGTGTAISNITLGSGPNNNAEDLSSTGLNLGSIPDSLGWHHYAGVYNSSTGVRSLYVDGVLRANSTNNAVYTMVPQFRLLIGGRDNTSAPDNNWFNNGMLYDVRIHNYPLTSNQVAAMVVPDPALVSNPQNTTAYEGQPTQLAALARGTGITYQWQFNNVNLANGSFNGAILSGVNSNFLSISYVNPAVAGLYRIVATGNFGAVTSANATLSVVPTVPPPVGSLVGQWISGAANLADTSGYTPAGTHNGYGVAGAGVASSNYAFTNDLPAGMTGQALTFTGNTAIAITNSSKLDAGYVSTFDSGLSSMTVMTWAKGWPSGQWNPFVSKHGEGSVGWQLRRNGGNNPTWTLRGTANGDMAATSITIGNDGRWHHYAGTFTTDGVTGVRNLYVDGVLRATQAETAFYATATNAHLTIGGRDAATGNSFGNYYNGGTLYGVKIYNVALTADQINSALVWSPQVPVLNPPVLSGGNLILNWSIGTLLSSTNVLGPWSAVSGATSPYTNTVSSAPQMYYKVSNP